MTEIRKDTPGTITTGRWKGQTILIEDQTATTGGYLILIGPNEKGEQGGDLWVEAGELEAAFEEAGWEIQWSR
jgi:hypothetical protein